MSSESSGPHIFDTNVLRIVCISDTHDEDFRGAVPDGDILLHTGDFTDYGGQKEMNQAFEWIRSLPHLVKVLVAGNHDLGLDPGHKAFDASVLQLFTSREAHEHGIYYLNQETRTVAYFKRPDSREPLPLMVYGNPSQPDFLNTNPYAFTYSPSPSPEAAKAWKSAPDRNQGVQIWATHGPPDKRLDWIDIPRLRGCIAQAQAVAQARPLLCVFGHYHVSNGIELVRWKYGSDEIDSAQVLSTAASPRKCTFSSVDDGKGDLVPGRQTLFVNAAYMTSRKREVSKRNSPFIITLEL
ncbi:hypothetical protein NA57DRAFT_68920 [Rhizodiscina lignyota]|uniref:Calcineurin-like phosphoesterase domain-containing protein n=1 Tax=Rhizodiscina lignyota TaxID=1504668 RepID=A0A9P4I2P8_9PEZI|nr:hypothetical protein NA57DRAFT_68920 [Rhizodiscina lignyota]